MHCCNWAVLSSITSVSVSSRRPVRPYLKPIPASSPCARYPILHRSRCCHKVAGFVVFQANGTASDAAPVRVRVALEGAASEPGHPEDREHDAHRAGGDPDPGDDEQEDDPEDDECDPYADH